MPVRASTAESFPQPPDRRAYPAGGGVPRTGAPPFLKRSLTVAGRRLRYVDVGAGPTLLLVHGLGASWRVWEDNIVDLAVDHRVIAVDLPGFGRSQTQLGAVTIARYAEALAELLDRLDLSATTCVGHSLGGIIAQHLAVLYPARVEALMLVSSAGQTPGRQELLSLRMLALTSSVLSRLPGLAPLATIGFRTTLSLGPVRRRVLQRAIHDPAGYPASLAAEMLTGAMFSPGFADALRAGLTLVGAEEAATIRCPTLIVAGERDRFISAEAVGAAAALIPGAVIEIWPDVGHHPMLERRATFNARLRRFVRETAPARTA